MFSMETKKTIILRLSPTDFLKYKKVKLEMETKTGSVTWEAFFYNKILRPIKRAKVRLYSKEMKHGI